MTLPNERLEMEGGHGTTWVLCWVEDDDIRDDVDFVAVPVRAQFLDRRTRNFLRFAWDFEDEG